MSAEKLDALFGDLRDADNPVGYASILAADERHEMLAEGERLLDAYGMNAEFVPAAYGGRLVRADRLAEVQRVVWRHDPCLGLGYGFSSLLGSVNIWSAGTHEQRTKAAEILLGAAGSRPPSTNSTTATTSRTPSALPFRATTAGC